MEVLLQGKSPALRAESAVMKYSQMLEVDYEFTSSIGLIERVAAKALADMSPSPSVKSDAIGILVNDLVGVFEDYFDCRLSVSRNQYGEGETLSSKGLSFIQEILAYSGIQNERGKPFSTQGLERLVRRSNG